MDNIDLNIDILKFVLYGNSTLHKRQVVLCSTVELINRDFDECVHI
jgi:hypothetical protein